MFATAPTQGTVQSGKKHQGLAPSGSRDTGYSSVNPYALPGSLAADPRYLLLRLPRIDSANAPLFSENTWKGVSPRHTPSRTTLHSAIKVQHLQGRLSAERAQWLADNKDSPLLMLIGIEQGFNDYADPQNHLNNSVIDGYAQSLPLRSITRFTLNWLAEAPDLIDTTLVDHLLCFKRHQTGDHSGYIDLTGFEKALESTLNNVARHLHSNIHRSTTKVGYGELSTFDVRAIHGADGGLALMCQQMMGLALDLDIDNLSNDAWACVKLALELISKHLHPISTPVEISEMFAFEEEEAEDELTEIAKYLTLHNLDTSEENVEKAIEVADTGMIDCFSTWEDFDSRINERDETRDRWHQPHTADLDTLRKLIESLAPAPNQLTEQTYVWLSRVEESLSTILDTHQSIDFDSVPDFPELMASIQQPIFLSSEEYTHNTLQMVFEGQMSCGDEEDVFGIIDWKTPPRDIIELTERLGCGIELLDGLLSVGS